MHRWSVGRGIGICLVFPDFFRGGPDLLGGEGPFRRCGRNDIRMAGHIGHNGSVFRMPPNLLAVVTEVQ
jgi:hypothetical protein